MKKTFFFIPVVVLCTFFSFKSYSQGNVSIHGGLVIPVLEFGSDDEDEDNAGGAGYGVQIGLEYIHPITEDKLGFIGGVDLVINGLQQSIKEDVEDAVGSDVDIDFPTYFNVPISGGLNYYFVNNADIGLFGNACLVVNYLQISDYKMSYGGQTVTQSVDHSVNIGFKLGLGLSINTKTSLSLNYYGLGEHDVDGKMKGSGLDQDFDFKQKVDFLSLTLGFRF